MLISLGRILLIATILAASIGFSLLVSLTLAHAGFLGTCQDGACELVALIYVTPFLSLGIYALALTAYSMKHSRRKRRSIESR